MLQYWAFNSHMLNLPKRNADLFTSCNGCKRLLYSTSATQPPGGGTAKLQHNALKFINDNFKKNKRKPVEINSRIPWRNLHFFNVRNKKRNLSLHQVVLSRILRQWWLKCLPHPRHQQPVRLFRLLHSADTTLTLPLAVPWQSYFNRHQSLSQYLKKFPRTSLANIRRKAALTVSSLSITDNPFLYKPLTDAEQRYKSSAQDNGGEPPPKQYKHFLSPCTSSTQTCALAEAQCPLLAHSWSVPQKSKQWRYDLPWCNPWQRVPQRRCDCGKVAHLPQAQLSWVTLGHLFWCVWSHHKLTQSSQGHASSHTPRTELQITKSNNLSDKMTVWEEYLGFFLAVLRLDFDIISSNDVIMKTFLKTVQRWWQEAHGRCEPCESRGQMRAWTLFTPLRCVFLTPKFIPTSWESSACVWKVSSVQRFTKVHKVVLRF